MFCEECKERPAEVHIGQMVNGKKVELHLCGHCAAKKGFSFFSLGDALSLPKLLGSLFGIGYSPVDPNQQAEMNGRCPNCGTTFSNIGQQGRLGCRECYSTFQNHLEPILRRIHGNSMHIGKIPNRGAGRVKLKRQIEELKEKLQAAVAREEYEVAAQLRDSVKKLEKELG
ncbi:MAG: UvrB/UvrC motif-containing protein [Chitinophagales bacterium]